ncbi:MAG: Y-family DNA polymerase [Cognaticolwellia sp.]
MQASKAVHVADEKPSSSDTHAVVIVDSKKNSIVQLNDSAKEQGIRLGMGLAMAASLADELSVLPYKKAEEAAYLDTLAEQLYSVSANIAIFPPHGLALQVDDMLRLYQRFDNYITTIDSVLMPFRLNYHLACGYSPISAQVLACACSDDDAYILNTDKTKITAALAKLPIERLFISHKAITSMLRLGIKTIGQLKTLSIAELAKRFDHETMDYLAQLNGKITKSLTFYQTKHRFEHSIDLLYEIVNSSVLLQPIKQLLLLLEAFLLRLDFHCMQINITLFQRADGGSHAIQQSVIVSSAAGEYLAKHWLNLVSLKLPSVKLLAPISKVSLSVTQFQENTGEVDDIFSGRKGQLSMAQLASLLSNKLGDESVLRIQLGNDHRVELASHYLPYVSAKLINSAKISSKQSGIAQVQKNKAASKQVAFDKNVLRPSFILAKPEPLISNVDILHGPERIETAWWQQGTKQGNPQSECLARENYQRDYYIAKNAQGQCCWLYREANNQWYIHGYFS